MFLPVSSIPEEYLYRLIPQGVIDLDTRGLIEAILGGYQDRVSDLRSYTNQVPELVNPRAELPQTGYNVVLVKFEGPVGQVITRSLDILPSAPSLDDSAALVLWAAEQLEIEPDRVISAIAGTDALRRVDIDSLSLLASNVGALLYRGLDDDTDDKRRETRQRLLESWFPRLRIKGTAKSFEALGRIIGFNDVAVTPLWSRLAPRTPNDPGNPVSDPDFSARPEQEPAASLPDPRYNPLDTTDGEFYAWDSGPLSEDPDDSAYWPLAVNNRQPFIKLAVLGDVVRPEVGRYTLAGGAPNRKASILLNAGTTESNLRADAVADGDSFNGLRVNVVDHGGTAVGLSIVDRMSAVKYRSSYFDLKATIIPTGTEPAQPSPDLEENPSLTSDGVAVAPFRPWTGGSTTFDVQLFPDPVSNILVQVAPRVQASGTETQFDREQFDNAERASEALDELRAATRRIRSKNVGVAVQDTALFAPFIAKQTIYAPGSGTTGAIAGPTLPYSVSLEAFAGTTPQDISLDMSVPGTVFAGGDGFLATLRLAEENYTVQATGGFAGTGTVVATFVAEVGTLIRSEPSQQDKANGMVAFLARAEDQFGDLRTPYLHDEDPWRRDPLMAGEELDTDLFLPTVHDTVRAIPADPPYRALTLSGQQQEIAVLDSAKAHRPYRFKTVQNPAFDPVTGALLDRNKDRLLLAVDADGNLHHAILIDKSLVSTRFWSPARWKNLAQWTPLNEHPLDSIQPASRNAVSVNADVQHYNRLWSTTRGWYTRLQAGDSISVVSGAELGQNFALALWVKPEISSLVGTRSAILRLGHLVLYLTVGGTPTVTLAAEVNGSATDLASSAMSDDVWHLIAIRSLDDEILFGVGTESSNLSWQSAAAIDPVAEQTTVLTSSSRAIGVHDLSLWSDSKSSSDLELIRVPDLRPTVVPYPTPYVESLSRDSRYVMRLNDAGFAYPDTDEVLTAAYRPAYIQRYQGDGLFNGDVKAKQVGLGDGDAAQALYTLGLRGIETDGFGRTLVSGSSSPLPGFVALWGTDAGDLARVTGPFGANGGVNDTGSLPASPWPNLQITNPTQDRVYVKGDDGLVYKVYVDDLGSGPELVAEQTLRARPLAENGTTPAFRDQPTDAASLLGTPGKVLSVAIAGTTYTPYEKTDAEQLLTTPPLYLYRQTQVVVDAVDAYPRWANQNLFGQSIDTPALESNGSLDFANPELISSGNLEISFDVSNVGALDDDFTGFSTTVSVIGSGGVVLASTPVTLLPDGAGLNPRGVTKVIMALDAAIPTAWILSVDWNNFRDVPRTGQIRRLAIHGFTVRRVEPTLFQVSLNPLTLTEVNTADTTAVYPGGVYAEVNSYGTIIAYRHESEVYPESASWPLSNLRTTSSWMRREKIRVLNPTVEPDPAAPDIPAVISTSPTPNSLYNIGDEAVIDASITHAGSAAAFVWRFWDSTVETTEVPQVTKVVTPGIGNDYIGSYSLAVIDRFGNQATGSGIVQINRPPVMNISSDREFGFFPYPVELSGTATDPDGHGLSLGWYENGTLFATGTPVAYLAEESTVIVGRATDSFGGVTERTIAIGGTPRKRPVGSPIIRPDIGRISITNTVNMAVYGLDPNLGGNLSFLWTTWAGTNVGTTTPVSNSNAKFNQITVPLIGQTPGQKTVRVVITDEEGYSLTIQSTIELIDNSPPIIESVTTEAPGALAGSIVIFNAVAIDEDGDAPGYTWNFTSPRALTLFGAQVEFQSLVSENGSIIEGTLTVDDNNGGSATAAIPSVYLSNLAIPSLTLAQVPGFYQTGFNQTISSVIDDVIIRYILDGTDVFEDTDGILYEGQFAFLPPESGTGTIIMKARAFKAGYAPSPQIQGAFVFFNPSAEGADNAPIDPSLPAIYTIQANADSLVASELVDPIAGDTRVIEPNPLSLIAGLTMDSVASEPQLPFTPVPIGQTMPLPEGLERKFVVLVNPI